MARIITEHTKPKVPYNLGKRVRLTFCNVLPALPQKSPFLFKLGQNGRVADFRLGRILGLKRGGDFDLPITATRSPGTRLRSQ